MMERIYKIKIELESTDPAEMLDAVIDITDNLLHTGLVDEKGTEDGIVQGKWSITNEERCEHCHGEGEIAEDEDDGYGHMMRGVNVRPCICQS